MVILTSRPRETSEPLFLDSLLGVFGYPAGSGNLLLAGNLPLRFYPGSFALRRPTWKLPQERGVQALVGAAPRPAGSGCGGTGPCWIRGAGGCWKRVRLTKKTASSVVHGDLHLLRGVRWKRLHASGDLLGFEGVGVKRRRLTLDEVSFPRVGVG